MRFPTKIPVSILWQKNILFRWSIFELKINCAHFYFPFFKKKKRSLSNAMSKKWICQIWKSVNFWCHKNSQCRNSFRSSVAAWRSAQQRRYSFWWTTVRWCRWAKQWPKFTLKIEMTMASCTFNMHRKKFLDNERTPQPFDETKQSNCWFVIHIFHICCFYVFSNETIYFHFCCYGSLERYEH